MQHGKLLFTEDYVGARKEIEALGGRVTQKFTDAVFAASLPSAVSPASLTRAQETRPEELDAQSLRMANAWESPDRQTVLGAAPGTEAPDWDALGLACQRERKVAIARRPGLRSTGTPTSEFMIGSVTVGLVIVSGTERGLAFTERQIERVIAKTQTGLSHLTDADDSVDLCFNWVTNRVTVDVKPCPEKDREGCATHEDYEKCEAPWRNAAMEQLGATPTWNGVAQYAEALRQENDSDWAFVGFITKYPLCHHGYASEARWCIEYSADTLWSEWLPQVVAHETCHLFGALDEYGDCKCDDRGGVYNVTNGNCRQCAGVSEPCLMKGGIVFNLCNFTRGQMGWNYWEQVGEAKWNGTLAMTALDGKLYPVASSGLKHHIYSVDAQTGAHTQVGNADWSGTLCAEGLDGGLYLVARSGLTHHLYRVNPSSESHEKIGSASWNGTLAMTSLNGKLYLVGRAGLAHHIYEVNHETGAYSKVGSADWGGTLAMTSLDGSLYLVSRSGLSHGLYCVNPASGQFNQIGDATWSGTSGMAALDGKLYLVARSGLAHHPYEVNVSTGAFVKLGNDNWNGTLALTALDGHLYAVSTYAVNKYLYRFTLNYVSA